jgi:hypothetical protein
MSAAAKRTALIPLSLWWALMLRQIACFLIWIVKTLKL